MQRAKHQGQKIMEILFRLSAQHVKTARFPVILLQRTVRTVLEKLVSMHVSLGLFLPEESVPILMPPSARNVENVPRPVLTMPLHI